MINITIDPILLRWGPITIGWHGLWLAAGVAVGCLVFLLEGRIKGIDRDRLVEFILWIVISGYVGARLMHVLVYDWETYAAQPLRILAIHDGGLAVYGALIGGTIAAIAYTRRMNLSFWYLVDATAVAIPVGMIVGRVGCTILGDVWGVPTHGSWGLVYWHPNASIPAHLLGVPTFPAPIMMQIWNLGLLALLLVLRRRVRLCGALFLTYMILYSMGRFILNIWQSADPLLFGLKPTQVLALVVTSVAILALFYLRIQASSLSDASPGPAGAAQVEPAVAADHLDDNERLSPSADEVDRGAEGLP